VGFSFTEEKQAGQFGFPAGFKIVEEKLKGGQTSLLLLSSKESERAVFGWEVTGAHYWGHKHVK